MQGQETEVDDTFKLPSLIPRNSKCDLTKDRQDKVDVLNDLQATIKMETLPSICVDEKNRSKTVTFDNCVQAIEADFEQDGVLKLPNLYDSASSASLNERRFDKNCQTDKSEFSNLDSGQGTERHLNAINNNENFPQLIKNYEYQRDLRLTQCSQKLSRVRYSYFPRFPSPLPMNKREKLKKEVEEKTSKKRKEVIQSGTLRTKEEYSKIFLSVRKVEKQFVKKHKLSCRPLDSPFFLD